MVQITPQHGHHGNSDATEHDYVVAQRSCASAAAFSADGVQNITDNLNVIFNLHPPRENQKRDQFQNQNNDGSCWVGRISKPNHVQKYNGYNKPDETLFHPSVFFVL